MKDFLGNELNDGDNVVYASHHGRNSGASLKKGIVFGFTEHFVKLRIPRKHTINTPFDEFKISPEKVMKV